MSIQISLSFKFGTFAAISEYCHFIISKTDGVVRYKDLKNQIDKIKPLLAAYDTAILAASDGGKLLTQVKRTAKVDLLNAMEILAALTKGFSDGDPTYVTDAGFQLRQKAVHSKQPLPQPDWVYLKRGILSGTVEGLIQNLPPGVKELGIKYSYDGWVNEHNGTYSTGKKFVLAGLEVRKEVEVKVIYLGTYQRKSNESKPMPVFVL